jgi:hypothetical protein
MVQTPSAALNGILPPQRSEDQPALPYTADLVMNAHDVVMVYVQRKGPLPRSSGQPVYCSGALHGHNRMYSDKNKEVGAPPR